ncbi:MAG: hypothetical protein AB7J13_05555 [Pyrinomonadaceae bacterium]
MRKKSKIDIQENMSFTRESSVEHAKNDLAERLKIDAAHVAENGVTDREFPDMSLGAPEKDEMAAQMISSGWQISLEAEGKTYEYRADKYQLRLHNFEGANYVIK